MRIIQVNKFHYRRGGAEAYVLSVGDELRRRGHAVADFSMHHPKNLASPWSTYFISRVSFNQGGVWQRLRAIGRMMYSFEAKRKFTALIKDFRPDLIHLHNIYHQLSPSILPVAKKYGVPVVMHLHDYKIISPNYQLYDGRRICEDCAAPHWWRCFFKKCFNDSYVKSFLVSLESYVHHRVLKIYEKNIDLYVAPSAFMKRLCVEHGLPEEKIEILYNFIEENESAGDNQANKESSYLLYFGRLSREKGIEVAVRAMRMADSSWRLKIAGSGPAADYLKKLITELKLENRVELLGQLDTAELSSLIVGARAVLIPSVWYENMPFAALESLALGTPVIASHIGGLPELVADGENGFLCAASDPAAVAAALERLKTADGVALKRAAIRSVSALTRKSHVDSLLLLYGKSRI